MNEIVKYILISSVSVIVSVVATVFVLKKHFEQRLENFQDSVLKKQRDPTILTPILVGDLYGLSP